MRKIDSGTLELMRSVVGSSPASTRLQKTYEIEVVTPMFGGGVDPGVNDESKLIRETSIRGALRFWFRATVGAKFQTSEELFRCESEIFGTTDLPSRVMVRVSHVLSQASESYGDLSPKAGSTLGYALFPFASNQQNNTPERSGRRSTFDLTLSYPKEYEKDVETALWAWFNFGGIGARTRRGCGALFCKEFAPRRDGKKVVWRQNFVLPMLESARGIVRKWPTLGEALLHTKTSDPLAMWTFGVDDCKYFRQGLNFARNNGSNRPRPGRSFWPEPDALRRITGQHAPQHEPYADRPIAFPRAELGAPIVFHFKDRNDPKDVNLCPTEGERAGSPIIVKPLVFDDGKTAAPCVVFLNGPRVKKVVFGSKTEEFDVVIKQNATYRNSPLQGCSARGSAFEGFKNYVKHKGYEAIQ